MLMLRALARSSYYYPRTFRVRRGPANRDPYRVSENAPHTPYFAVHQPANQPTMLAAGAQSLSGDASVVKDACTGLVQLGGGPPAGPPTGQTDSGVLTNVLTWAARGRSGPKTSSNPVAFLAVRK